MTLLHDAVHLFLKIWSRAGDYFRGLMLFGAVTLTGGHCAGIPRVGRAVIFKYPPHAGIRIGKGCDIGPFCIFDIPRGGALNLGNNVKLTAGVFISAVSEIAIGDDCLVAEWVSIRDAQHSSARDKAVRHQPLVSDKISIESDVWIGRSSTILGGATLRKGCIVGAGSFVKDQELDSEGIYVGVPVRKVKERAS